MDQMSDGEDFIPPTPKIQNKKTNNLFPKPNSKVGKNHKRKKISGLSPDFKKVKSKCRQISLLNYMSRNKNTGDNSEVSGSAENKATISAGNLKPLRTLNFSSEALQNTYVNNFDVQNFSELTAHETKAETMKKSLSLNAEDSKNSYNECDLLLNKESFKISNTFEIREKELVKCNSTRDVLFGGGSVDILNNMKDSSENVSVIPYKIKDDVNIEIQRDSVPTAIEICAEVKNLKIDTLSVRRNDTSHQSKDILELPETKISELPNEDSFLWMQDLDWKNETFFEENAFSSKPQTTDSSFNKMKGSQMTTFLFKVQEIDRSKTPKEVKLTLKDVNSKLTTCILKGFWIDTLVNIGDVVHVMQQFERNIAVIDDQSGFLVVNPDFLLSSTAIVSTLFCMRKAVLNHILPSWSSGNKVMMIGNLVHDIYQQSVNNHVSTIKEVNEILDRVLAKQENLLALAGQSLSLAEIEEKVKEYVPSIVQWMKRHVSMKDMTASENLQITCVEGIEDNVWCPKYGIKGKIDMTVQAVFQNKHETKLLPLELKTGRPTYSAEHIGQINLYILMMEERTKETSEGLLLYLKDAANMKLVEANHNSRRGLIQLRNELAFYTYKWFSSPESRSDDIEHCHLPATINNKKLCQKCPYLLPCTVYQKAFSEDKKIQPDHAMVSLISSTTNHLTTSHLEYFLHWSNLLLLESTNSVISNSFWTEEPSSREKKGLCLSWMLLNNCLTSSKHEEKYFIHNFVRSPNSPVKDKLLNAGLKAGDYVAISNQENLDEVAISMGYIFEVYEDSIEVGMDRNLCSVHHYKACIFRIDKQVTNSATACIRNNLMLLMSNDQQSERLRKFIIDKQEPSFLNSLSKNVVLLGRPILKLLNKSQQKAVLKALMAEDYFLIKGMPGTGKTSTVVALVRLFVKMGVSVFLTSYTHSAVDNILLKLKEHIPFVRIGQGARMHAGIKEFSFESLTKDFKTVEQFKKFMEEQMVVATTSLGINHPIFSVRKFGVCIVDEASQINQTACLGPLFHAKKFILVGDDKQLLPLVTNEKARNKGMEESLFQRLGNSKNCSELTIQYRMNREIMRLCNEMTYNGILQCGSVSVEEAVLQLSIPDSSVHQDPAWILTVLNSELLYSVVFLNTVESPTSSSEVLQGQEINDMEASVILLILKYLLDGSILSKDIGIISPYRQQVDLIKRKVKDLKTSEIEVNTVDQYQGRDKDVIIISCVKSGNYSSENTRKGSILNDEKRLNVAITRARKKLIIIGCISSLTHFKPFADFISHLKKEQIVEVYLKDLPT